MLLHYFILLLSLGTELGDSGSKAAWRKQYHEVATAGIAEILDEKSARVRDSLEIHASRQFTFFLRSRIEADSGVMEGH